MNRRLRRGLVALAPVLIGGGFGIGYWAGYRAGVWDKTPQHRAVVVVKRNAGDGSISGNSAHWYDLHKPGDAARLQAEDERLTAQGVEHYIAEGRMEYSLDFVTPPNRINGHR